MLDPCFLWGRTHIIAAAHDEHNSLLEFIGRSKGTNARVEQPILVQIGT